MKAFYFLEDDLDQLPIDAQLVPFDINLIDPQNVSLNDRQKPKTWPSEKSPMARTKAILAEPDMNNPDASNPPVTAPRPGAEIKRLKTK